MKIQAGGWINQQQRSTVGGKEKSYESAIYEAGLRTSEGTIVQIQMYELPEITGKISRLDENIIGDLFPQFDPKVLMREHNTVDMLIGTDHYGLHPKRELAKAGNNLSVMAGTLGVCLVGTHPLLEESTQMESDVPRMLHLSEHRVVTNNGLKATSWTISKSPPYPWTTGVAAVALTVLAVVAFLIFGA